MKIISMLRKVYESPVLTFIIIGSVFGGLSALATSPFDKPDESANFLRAYSISNGQFYANSGKNVKGDWRTYNDMGVREDNGTEGTVTIPSSYSKARECLGIPGSYPWFADTKVDEHPLVATDTVTGCISKTPLNSHSTEHLVAAAPYSPISFLPQVIAIYIGKVFNLSVIVMDYAGRMLNYALWIALVALAIRIMPVRRWALAFVCLLPSFIFNMSHLTPDATLFGSIAVFLAIIIRSLYITQKQLEKEDKKLLLGLLISAVVMVIAKNSYGVVLLPLMLFYGGLMRRKALKIISVGLLALLSFSPLNYWVTGDVTSVNRGIVYVMHEFPKVLAIQLKNGDVVSPTTFNGTLIMTPSQSWMMLAAAMMLGLIMFISYKENFKLRISELDRKLMIVGGLAVAGLVYCGALYLLWGQFGNLPVPLFPGRYLLSLLMLFAVLPLASKFVTTEEYYKKTLLIGVLLLNIAVWGLFIDLQYF